MEKYVSETKTELGELAAKSGVEGIKQALEDKGEANIILATGASQFEVLQNLIRSDVDWSKVNMFHLDEYIGLPENHPAGFRKYLQERFVDKVGEMKSIHFVNGDAADPVQECERLGEIIKKHPIDVAFIGIGENGHVAFNDPPADFDTEEAFIVVELDDACRRQQLGEGWFSDLSEVPEKAISMSIKQILKSKKIIVSVPDKRKAQAVKDTFECDIDPNKPSTILRTHSDCALFLDKDSASMLSA